MKPGMQTTLKIESKLKKKVEKLWENYNKRKIDKKEHIEITSYVKLKKVYKHPKAKQSCSSLSNLTFTQYK